MNTRQTLVYTGFCAVTIFGIAKTKTAFDSIYKAFPGYSPRVLRKAYKLMLTDAFHQRLPINGTLTRIEFVRLYRPYIARAASM